MGVLLCSPENGWSPTEYSFSVEMSLIVDPRAEEESSFSCCLREWSGPGMPRKDTDMTCRRDHWWTARTSKKVADRATEGRAQAALLRGKPWRWGAEAGAGPTSA